MATKKAKARTLTASEDQAEPALAQTPTQFKIERDNADYALSVYGDDPAALTFPDNMPEEDFLKYGTRIGKVMEFASWRIGDYVNFGKKQYGYKDYKKIEEATGLAAGYLRNCASVADRVPASLRHTFGMEKFRMMLAHRDDAEPIEKLVARLGDKSASALREMSAGGTGSRKDDNQPLLANELGTLLKRIVEAVPSWDKDRVTTFAVVNRKVHRPDSPASGTPLYYQDLLASARNVLGMLAEQVEAIDAENDAKQEAARDAANEAHDAGDLDPKVSSGKKGEKPF